MMTDTRIYGYSLGVGLIVCPGCYDHETDGRPGGPEGVYPLYSHNLDGTGLSCDGCHEWVDEPYLDLAEQADGWEIGAPDGFDLSDAPDTVEVLAPDADPVTGWVECPLDHVDTGYGFAVAVWAGPTNPVAVWASPVCSARGLADLTT